MNKEKIIQVISDFDDLRKKIIGIACKKMETDPDTMQHSDFWVQDYLGQNGVMIETYDYDGFSWDCFLTWEELNDKN